eukprot:240269-Rhodomonas_salina.1
MAELGRSLPAGVLRAWPDLGLILPRVSKVRPSKNSSPVPCISPQSSSSSLKCNRLFWYNGDRPFHALCASPALALANTSALLRTSFALVGVKTSAEPGLLGGCETEPLLASTGDFGRTGDFGSGPTGDFGRVVSLIKSP